MNMKEKDCGYYLCPDIFLSFFALFISFMLKYRLISYIHSLSFSPPSHSSPSPPPVLKILILPLFVPYTNPSPRNG